MKTKSLILILAIAPVMVQAQVNYAISGDTAYVRNSQGAAGDIVITNNYKGYPVTSIGDSAFYFSESLTSVTIPNSVTSIEEEAFYGCESLTSVTIGTNVTSIGDDAFEASGLTNITIPDSVTNIGEGAFAYSGLTSVTIGTNVISIGEDAFYGCASLTSVTIPNSVTNIGDDAFLNCVSLTSVTIPNSVTSIGDNAFQSSSLTNVTIGTNVISIGDEAFIECLSLTSVTIPNSVISIGEDAFGYCTSLTSAIFQGNAPSYKASVFSGDFSGDGATVYYYYGTSGWSSYFSGLPTVMLGAPAPQVGSGSIGVQSGIFGFTLTGVTNQTVMVEASTNLVNWQPVWTNTLFGTSTNFADGQWRNYPSRFYRVSSP